MDPILYLISWYLTMSDDDFRSIFYNTLDLLRECINPSDSIVQDDHLSSSLHLMLDRMCDDSLIPSRDDRLDGFFLFWWGGDDRYFLES